MAKKKNIATFLLDFDFNFYFFGVPTIPKVFNNIKVLFTIDKAQTKPLVMKLNEFENFTGRWQFIFKILIFFIQFYIYDYDTIYSEII